MRNTNHLSTEWEVSGQQDAHLFFDRQPEMSRSLLMEIARGAQFRARLTGNVKKCNWADGFHNILTTLAVMRQ